MSIKFNKNNKTFKLDANETSYIIKIFDGGYLLHLYYGAYISDDDVDYLLVKVNHDSIVPNSPDVPYHWFSCDIAPFEYPGNLCGDFRPSAVSIRNCAGNTATDFRYVSHKIYNGKPTLDKQPAVYLNADDEADTLEITCRDKVTGAEAVLYYTVMIKVNAITRRTVIRNTSLDIMDIEKAVSANVDFTYGEYDFLHLYGTWGRERHVERTPLHHGTISVSSKRGSSSHHHNPFAALVSKNCDENHGDAYGFSLIYSGNFSIDCDTDPFGMARMTVGINSVDFSWRLESREEFVTPEAVLVYSDKGLGEMSRTFHKLYRDNLCRGEWKHKPRPILVNNWEATYFNFDDDKLLAIAKDAAQVGIEMLVMDDGWFGERNNDRSSLGDWFVNENKIRCGLREMTEKVNALGLKFGIWFEPEMISPYSRLYRAHPDWCLHIEGRDKSLARNQYVLDITREDVRDYIFDAMSNIIKNANIAYVKWDFNRNLTEVGSAILPPERQKEMFHRYVLGLYDLLERITTAFPHLLLEGCASGGGRYDPAMLYYAPQYWTSDDTDAMERIEIQLGTSVVYPASTMSCHVSASPNHQTGRATSFATRGNIAMAGAFGYELDLTKLTDDEKALMKKQIDDYHRFWHIINEGNLYRLIHPSDAVNYNVGKCAAWMYVTDDRTEALFTIVVIRASIHPVYFVQLEGLDPGKKYKIEGDSRVYSGDTLMRAGLNLTRDYRDGDSVVLHIQETVNES